MRTASFHVNFIGAARNIAVLLSFISRGLEEKEANVSGSTWPCALTLLAAGFTISCVGLSEPTSRAEVGKVSTASAASQYLAEAPFIAENNAAMDKMMKGMEVNPTGNVDVD